MCGGKGTRMASSMEKSLVKLGSKTLIERVLDALVEYRHFESIIAMPSLNTPATSTFLYTHEYYTSGKIKVLEGRGVNYSLDLSYVLSKVKPAVVFVVSADLPLLNPILIHSSRCKINSELEENYLILNEKEIAININTVVELKTAERLFYS